MVNMTIIGNICATPVMREVQTQKGMQNVCSFTVAVNRRQGNDPIYFRCSAWGKTGENIAKYFDKGRKIAMTTDDIRTSTYQASDGSTRVNLDITVQSWDFCQPMSENQNYAPASHAPTAQNSGFEVVEDEGLPF